MKTCPRCGKTKPDSEFYKTSYGWCKECKKERNRERYAPIKAKVRTKRLAQYKDGKKQCKQCKLWLNPSEFNKNSYHWDNLEHICRKCKNKKTREYYRENKEKCLNASRDWYQKNKERRRRVDREWRRNNPEKSRAIWHRHKSRKLEADGDFTQKQWKALKKYYCFDGICLGCGEKKRLTVDHIIPLIKGGSNFITNIQPICQSCNSAKGDERIIDYRPDKGKFAEGLLNES